MQAVTRGDLPQESHRAEELSTRRPIFNNHPSPVLFVLVISEILLCVQWHAAHEVYIEQIRFKSTLTLLMQLPLFL